jgi:hypothetical protein
MSAACFRGWVSKINELDNDLAAVRAPIYAGGELRKRRLRLYDEELENILAPMAGDGKALASMGDDTPSAQY